MITDLIRDHRRGCDDMQGTVVFTIQTSALGKTPGYMPSDVSLTQTWNQGCGGGGSVAVVCWEEGGSVLILSWWAALKTSEIHLSRRLGCSYNSPSSPSTIAHHSRRVGVSIPTVPMGANEWTIWLPWQLLPKNKQTHQGLNEESGPSGTTVLGANTSCKQGDVAVSTRVSKAADR